MTDIRTLLHEAAPRTAVELDLEELRRQAGRHSLRRVASWLAAGLAVLAIAVPTGQTILSPADHGPAGLDVRQVDGGDLGEDGTRRGDTEASSPTSIDDDPTHGSVIAGEVAGPIERLGMPSPDRAIVDTTSTTTSAATTTAPPDMSAWWAPDPEYPARSGCSVDDAGLAPRRERRCQFTATVAGGASVDPEHSSVPSTQTADQVRVTVRRPNGEVMEWSGTRSYGVGDAQVFFGCDVFIEPGDRVEVAIVAGDDPARTTVHAGEGHTSC